MKKLVYTLSFVALVGLTGKAQDHKAKDQLPAKRKGATIQGTMTPVPVESATLAPEPKNRMAITQKGVPASKAKPAEEATPQAQPANTSEKH